MVQDACIDCPPPSDSSNKPKDSNPSEEAFLRSLEEGKIKDSVEYDNDDDAIELHHIVNVLHSVES